MWSLCAVAASPVGRSFVGLRPEATVSEGQENVLLAVMYIALAVLEPRSRMQKQPVKEFFCAKTALLSGANPWNINKRVTHVLQWSSYLLGQRFCACFVLKLAPQGREKGESANLKTKHTDPLT